MATPPTRVSLSPFENLTVGAFGGALETCIQMPILTAKFCIQEGRPYPTTISGWYRGVAVQAGTVAPITAIQFMVNGMLQSLAVRGERREPTDIEKIYTAAGAGAISALVYSPVDLITIQQQKLILNPIQTARYIVREHGFRSLFRGFSSCAAREAIYTAGYLGLAPVVTSYLSRNISAFEDKPFVAALTGAWIAGTFSAFLTHPMDTVKTCLQADIGGQTWSTARDSFSRLVKEEGAGSLYKGFLPRTVRVCGAFFVCMSIREMATDYKNDFVI